MLFICSNIPSNIFYSAVFSAMLRIMRCTLKFEDLKPRLKSLFEQMIRQGATHCYICRQIGKGFWDFQKKLINLERICSRYFSAGVPLALQTILFIIPRNIRSGVELMSWKVQCLSNFCLFSCIFFIKCNYSWCLFVVCSYYFMFVYLFFLLFYPK